LVAYDAEVKRLERVGTVDVDAGVPRIRTGSVADVTPLLELPPVRFTLRGEPSPQSLAEELARDARRQVIESFRQLPDQERALEELGRTCQQNPESCR